MYRGMLVTFIMVGLLGVNIHGWGRAGVNHVLIFELDPRHHLTYVNMLMVSIKKIRPHLANVPINRISL